MTAGTPDALGGHRPRAGRRVMVVALSLGVLFAGIYAAYAADVSPRSQLAPIQWEGTMSSRAIGVTIELEENGVARVVNLPEGQEHVQRYGERGYVCFEQAATKDTFTGAATWEWIAERGIRLRFGTSSLILRAGQSGPSLPDPDWTHPSFNECGDDTDGWLFTVT